MKKFIAKVIIFAITIVAIDFIIGKTCTMLIRHAVGGDTKRMTMIVDELKDDIIIFGSSRACRHYDPLILQDSISMTCYNAGLDGNGIIYNYGQYRLMKARYTPKVIIYDIYLSYDLLEDDKPKYLYWLKRYYERPSIDSIFWAVDNTQRIKMMSQMYRYNGSFLQLVSDCIHPMREDVKGYRPLDKTMAYEPIIKPTKKKEYKYDSLKLEYWQRFITDCKLSGTKLIFTMSPLYRAHPEDIEPYQPIIDIAQKNGIPFIDHYTDTAYCTKRKYFKDTAHMNRLGATTFTKAIIKELLPLIEGKGK